MGFKYRKWLVGMFCSIAVLSAASMVRATTRDVCKNMCAFNTIQAAIGASSDGDVVRVHDGTYVENISIWGKRITVSSVNGPGLTIIDGHSAGSVVTFDNGEGAGTWLKGFTITKGNAAYGGGIYCRNSSPSIVNCVIKGNAAPELPGGLGGGCGGGIYITGVSQDLVSSPSIANCTISGNSGSSGGGIWCGPWSSPTIANCTISGNSVTGYGGGIYSSQSSLSLANCYISGNQSVLAGGGIACSYSSPSITGCTIRGNSVTEFGGGIHCANSSPSITNCTISGNYARDKDGGGIFCLGFSSPTFTNCTISGNLSLAGHGGGISMDDGGTGGHILVVNSILWGDNSFAQPEIAISSGGITITYSNIQGGWLGNGNISADPRFIDPRPSSSAPTEAGNYHLRAGSPCISKGAGPGTYFFVPAYDLDWDPRPQGYGYDMGSDEYALVRNGSFENTRWGAINPGYWVRVGLSLSDKLITTVKHGGYASFTMCGSSSAVKQLQQSVNVSGSAGKYFNVACWHKATLTDPKGGFFGVVLDVCHTDGTAKTYYMDFPKGTYDWRRTSRLFAAEKDFTKVKVTLRLSGQTGKVWFDDVQLAVRTLIRPPL